MKNKIKITQKINMSNITDGLDLKSASDFDKELIKYQKELTEKINRQVVLILQASQKNMDGLKNILLENPCKP